MIIVAHVIMFVVLFAAGVPGLSSVFGPEVAFGGGLLAIVLMALASEVVVLGSAVIARAIALALKINPLLQRKKATLIAHAVIFVALSGYLAAVSFAFPQVITVSLTWAMLLSGLTVAVLEVMVRFKRYLIARS